MRRHAIIMCLGEHTNPKVAIPKDIHVATTLPFINNSLPANQRITHEQLFGEMKRLGLHPPELAMDLIVLAIAIYAADTRISRACDSQDGWSREIDLHVPVSKPNLWRKQTVLLEDMLRFLTGDIWRIYFRPRPSQMHTLSPTLKKEQQYVTNTVCLFSGGLDSFIGAIDLIESGVRPLLLGHHSSADVSAPQIACVNFLQEFYPTRRPELFRAYIGVSRELFNGIEESTRSRSFLFFSLAAACASALGEHSRLIVPENGLISLNPPLTPLRLGALSTRTTHPYFMARFQDLLDALRLGVQMDNPYRFKTKGEMVLGCGNKKALKKFAHKTMSCAHSAAGRYEKQPGLHCGTCVPCIVRQAAFNAAHILDKTTYRRLLQQRRALNSMKSEGEDVRACQIGISRLKDDPNVAEIEVYQSGPLPESPDLVSQYVSVYQRGMAEVAALLASVKAKPR